MLTRLSCERAVPASAGSRCPGFFGRYTKVNRLLTEGRQAFLRRVSGIERGAECARYEPLLSALADGEASAEQLAILRPHMRTCLSCRARLREFRATPERVAALVPPAALAAADGGPLRSLLESALAAAQHKAAALGERAHTAAELATGQKVAAVAASAAALAGGGTAIDELANHRHPPQPAQAEELPKQPATEAPPDQPPPVPPAPTPTEGGPGTAGEPVPAPTPEPEPAPPGPANEFDPAAAAAPSAPPPPASPSQPSGAGFAPGGGSSGSGARGSSGNEFAP